MKWDDFSKFFKERYDFCSTLKNWEKPDGRSGCSHAATYFFLMDPLEKVNQMETDIVYIGETVHLGSDPDNCRLWDLNQKNDTIVSLDKDIFRNDLGGLIEAYGEIYRRINNFI